MSDDFSLFPGPQRDDDWQEEFPLQVDLNTPSGRYASVNRFAGQKAENTTGRLRSAAAKEPSQPRRSLSTGIQFSGPSTEGLTPITGKMASRPVASVAPAKPLTTISRPIPAQFNNVPTNQSLLANLQSTIQAQQPKREVVVIPGSRKRRLPAEASGNQVRLQGRVRHGAVIAAIILVMLVTFMALTPLGNGQTASPMVSGIVNWVRTEQQQWQIMAHNDDQGNQTAANAPGTSPANPPALPPAALPTSQYVAIAQQDAISVGIPPTYFVQQINVESGFNPGAISPSGAVGIAQMIPSTAAGIGVNPYDPVSALDGAARLMAGYYKQYGDYAKALAAYNAGSGTVNYAVQAGGANWMSFLPAETRNYIFRIMGI
jgi:soluble lytic murein transglycosylase-like protein